jgi:hypothetical protein
MRAEAFSSSCVHSSSIISAGLGRRELNYMYLVPLIGNFANGARDWKGSTVSNSCTTCISRRRQKYADGHVLLFCSPSKRPLKVYLLQNDDFFLILVLESSKILDHICNLGVLCRIHAPKSIVG